MALIAFSDTILVPLSLFIIVSYHGYFWHNFKHKTYFTTPGLNTQKRRLWFQDMEMGDYKKGMLAVQSLRNTLMGIILTATISFILSISLAALANNAYAASDILNTTSPLFGSQSSKLLVLKFGLTCLLLMNNDQLLVQLIGRVHSDRCKYFSQCARGVYIIRMILEQGFTLSVMGNRVLCMAFPVLFRMFGPVSVIVSSGLLVWGLFELDICKPVGKMK